MSSNTRFHFVVLKIFIGIWSVHEKDWSQNKHRIETTHNSTESFEQNFFVNEKLKLY